MDILTCAWWITFGPGAIFETAVFESYSVFPMVIILTIGSIFSIFVPSEAAWQVKCKGSTLILTQILMN